MVSKTKSGKKKSKTASLIQQIATEMFAMNGYDGTIMDEVARVSGANKASIYYHFKSKELLYERCMTDLFRSVVEPLLEDIDKVSGSVEKLRCYVSLFAKYAQRNSLMPAALMREISSGGMHMPKAARQEMQKLLFALKSILEQGANNGTFKIVDPVSTHFMVMGSLCFYITSEPMRRAIESEEVTDPTVDVVAEEIFSMLNAALTT